MSIVMTVYAYRNTYDPQSGTDITKHGCVKKINPQDKICLISMLKMEDIYEYLKA